MQKINVIQFLDSKKVVIVFKNRTYIRTIRKNISDVKYVTINKQELEIVRN